MPVLKDFRPVRTIKLTTVEGGEAEVYSDMLAADYEKIARYGEDKKPLCLTLALLIKSWNLTDEAGSPLPINEENVGKLNFTDTVEIQKDMQKTSDFLAAPSETTRS